MSWQHASKSTISMVAHMAKSEKQVNPEKEIAVLRVHLDGRKNISRDVRIRASSSLYALAEAIVIDAFGWDPDHSFGFYNDLKDYHDSTEIYELFADMGEADERRSGAMPVSVKKTKVQDVFDAVGKKMQFLFDYGDEHLFVVELIAQTAKQPKHGYPMISNVKGKVPEQYEAA
jgi:hypothetical protein